MNADVCGSVRWQAGGQRASQRARASGQVAVAASSSQGRPVEARAATLQSQRNSILRGTGSVSAPSARCSVSPPERWKSPPADPFFALMLGTGGVSERPHDGEQEGGGPSPRGHQEVLLAHSWWGKDGGLHFHVSQTRHGL